MPIFDVTVSVIMIAGGLVMMLNGHQPNWIMYFGGWGIALLLAIKDVSGR
jgi:hypothetical protein